VFILQRKRFDSKGVFKSVRNGSVLLLDLVSQDVFIKTEIGLIESLFQEGLVQCLPLYAKYASMNWLLFAANNLRWRFVVNMAINLRDY
jgi:hypothetical protein